MNMGIINTFSLQSWGRPSPAAKYPADIIDTNLASVVRHALGEASARPVSWAAESLGWVAVNPAALGLYRLIGLAKVGSRDDVAWAIVARLATSILPAAARRGLPARSTGLQLLDARLSTVMTRWQPASTTSSIWKMKRTA